MSLNCYSILCSVLLLYTSKKVTTIKMFIWLFISVIYIYYFLIEPSIQQNLFNASQTFMIFFPVTN